LRRQQEALDSNPDSISSNTYDGVTFYLLPKGVLLPPPTPVSPGLQEAAAESSAVNYSSIPVAGELIFKVKAGPNSKDYLNVAEVEYKKFEKWADLYRQKFKHANNEDVFLLYNDKKTEPPRMFHGIDQLKRNLKLEGLPNSGLSHRIDVITSQRMSVMKNNTIVVFRSTL
jgi:hypothetical protein